MERKYPIGLLAQRARDARAKKRIELSVAYEYTDTVHGQQVTVRRFPSGQFVPQTSDWLMPSRAVLEELCYLTVNSRTNWDGGRVGKRFYSEN